MSCLSPVHTVGFQIEESIRLHYPHTSRSEARDRAATLLDQVGIPDPRYSLEKRILSSSAEACCNARSSRSALAAEPDLLIADEPTTAIDVTIQAVSWNLPEAVAGRAPDGGAAHHPRLGREMAEVCEQVAVMYLGKVVEIGPIEQDIFNQPHHPYPHVVQIDTNAGRPSKKQAGHHGSSVPTPLSRPPGCPFSDRCPDFMAGQCELAAPDLRAVEGPPPGGVFSLRWMSTQSSMLRISKCIFP